MKDFVLPSHSELLTLPKDGGDQFNRLVFESSLYLRSHAHQKINWYPWGQDAFDLAKITDKPLFLSIGYAACHWCHVMSDMTFDLDDVADLLNKHFVAIKIDRDEHPDIDQIYMSATQLLNQHGGWPNSVFCLPTGQPFYAGTYFPADDHPKGPGFKTLINQLADAWANNRSNIDLQAQELDSVIKKMNHFDRDPYGSMQLREGYNSAISVLKQQFDSEYAGFGSQPKFPPYASLRLLLSNHSPDMAIKTLDAMALSGLFDQVDGGFHRYSTDREWHCPHFEKMLTDNAQMIEIYSLAYHVQPSDLYEQVVTDTIQHLQSDWQKDDVYIHSIDADSDGGEGVFYVVSYSELEALFKELDMLDQFESFCQYFQVTQRGNMLDEATQQETGYNILNPSKNELDFDWQTVRATLQKFRQNHRVRPLKNEHISIAANALLAYGLLQAGTVFNHQGWLDDGINLAKRLFEMVNKQSEQVYLDDVVYVLRAFSHSALADQVTSIEWLWDHILDHFYDPVHGGAWYSQVGHRTPISRIKDIYDQAVPSPNGVLIELAVALYIQFNRPQYYKIALDIMTCFMSTVLSAKQGCDTFWLAVLSYWSFFEMNDLEVQFVSGNRSGDTVHLTIDLMVPNGSFIEQRSEFKINGDLDYGWKQLSVDPYKSRRVEWSDQVIRCATGRVRVTGICDIKNCPDQIELMVPVCTDQACLPDVMVAIPITV